MFRIVDLITCGRTAVFRVAFSVLQFMFDEEAKAGRSIDAADS